MRFLYLFLIFFLHSIIALGGITGLEEIQGRKVRYDTAPAPIPLEFEEEKISFYKASESFDYSERSPQESWWSKFKRYVKLKGRSLLEWLFGDYEAQGILLFLLQILPYVIIGGVFIFLIWLFNRLNPAGSILQDATRGKVFLTEDEEIIQSQNIEELINTAVSEGKFSLAIRYQYLYILQLLNRRGIITYEYSKTNEDYSKEVKQEPIQQHFKQLSWIYDFIWYGSFGADKKAYESAEKEFRRMRELISQKLDEAEQ